MISETAKSRPNATSSQSEAPTGANKAAAMMMPLPDLGRPKGPQDRLCCLLLVGCRLCRDYGQAGAGLTA